MEGINRHSTEDVFSTYDPRKLCIAYGEFMTVNLLKTAAFLKRRKQ